MAIFADLTDISSMNILMCQHGIAKDCDRCQDKKSSNYISLVLRRGEMYVWRASVTYEADDFDVREMWGFNV